MTRLKLMAQKPTQQGFSVYFAANPGHHRIFRSGEREGAIFGVVLRDLPAGKQERDRSLAILLFTALSEATSV